MSLKRFARPPTDSPMTGAQRLERLEAHVGALHQLLEFMLDVVKVRVPRAATGSRIVLNDRTPTHEDLTLRELYVRLHHPPASHRTPTGADDQRAEEARPAAEDDVRH